MKLATGQSSGRRLSVLALDQALAGASNVAMSVLAARLLSVSSFGLFGILFLIILFIELVIAKYIYPYVF